jgi:hypothetical protein
MRRGIISSLGLTIAAVAFLAQPSHASDRKASSSAISHPVVASAVPTHVTTDGRGRSNDDPLSFALLNNAAAKSPRPVGHDATATERKEDEPTPARERKSVTFFRFDSKLGNVAVQPVIGSVKGAQFSLGF